MNQTDLWQDLTAVREVIDRCEPLVLCLDFDGTLVPIVDDPSDAQLSARASAILERLGDQDEVEVAIVSGRALDDLRDRVDVHGVTFAGNHGLEMQDSDDRWIHPVVEDVRPQLETIIDEVGAVIEDVPGAFIEDKYATVSIHYRNAPADRVPHVKQAVRERVTAASEIDIGTGKAVLQLRPSVDWNKGSAIERIARSVSDDALVLFVGDDVTDQDGFDAIDQLSVEGMTIAVGNTSLATQYRLSDPAAVIQWLHWLHAVTTEAVNTNISV